MLYAFFFFAAAFLVAEMCLLSVENRRCHNCKWCYRNKHNQKHCVVHDTSPYSFPDEYRKWRKWNRHTYTCIYYERKKRGENDKD